MSKRGFADFLRAMDDEGDEVPVRSTPPDVLAVTLKEIAERYAAPCPFKVGDLITPRCGYNMRGDGEPHVVVDVLADRSHTFIADGSRDTSAMAYGRRLDIRVVCETDGAIVAFWVESWGYEPWTGEVADLGRAA